MKAAKKAATAPSSRRTGLSKAARDLLARVRASPSPERVFGLEPAAADAMARGVIDPLIDGAALPLSKLNQYRWYVSELCRLMRTKSGPDLAYCMELLFAKWIGFGLEANTAVFLAGELFDRLMSEPGPDKSEVRMQIPECRSAESGTEPNDGRRTSNEETTGGGES